MSVIVEKLSVRGNGRLLLDLKPGETFICNGVLYMKLQDAFAGNLCEEGVLVLNLMSENAAANRLNPMLLVEVVAVLAAIVEVDFDKKDKSKLAFNVKFELPTPFIGFMSASQLGDLIGKQVAATLHNQGFGA